jgi:hypothetical protein
MRKAYLGAILLSGMLAGAALAASDPVPPSGGDEARWRPWTGYEPVREPGEGMTPVNLAARTCAAFEDENYNGRRLEAPDGAAMEWVGRQWNDRISSIACAPGCRLIAYQTIVFGGARANFTGARSRLSPVWNDRISALRVACDGAQADAAH